MNAGTTAAVSPHRPDYCLRPSLQWTHVIGRWNSWWVVSDPATGEHYRCGEREADAARRLGQSRPEQSEGGSMVLTALLSAQLAYDASRAQQAVVQEERAASWTRFVRGLAGAAGTIFYQRFALPVPTRLVTAASRSSGWLLSSRAVAWWTAWAVFSFAAFAIHCLGRGSLPPIWPHGSGATVGFAWTSGVAIFLVTRAAHELAHAVACVRAGGQCRRWGLVRVGVVAFPYVDVSDAWRMPRASSRIAVAAAGVYAECLIASLAVWVTIALPGTVAASIGCQTILITLGGSLLFNANPLMRYDGYYVFSELCELPDPHASARRLIVSALRSVPALLSRASGTGRRVTRPASGERRMPLAVAATLPVFATASLVYRCLLLFAAATAVLLTMHRWALGDVGWFLVFAAAGSSAAGWLLARGGEPRRAAAACVSLAVAAYVCFNVPLPYRFAASGSVVSIGRLAVYPPGSSMLAAVSVDNGGLRIDLKDADLERRLFEAEQRLAEASARERVMERAVYTQPDVLERLPQVRLVRGIRQRQLEALQQRDARREVQIDSEDIFLPLPLRSSSSVKGGDRGAAAWAPALDPCGEAFLTVLDPGSEGSAVEAASPMGYVCNTAGAMVEVFVPGEYLSEVWVGQGVRTIFDQDPTAVWSGRVQAVSQLTNRRDARVTPSGAPAASDGSAMGHYISVALEHRPPRLPHAEDGGATVVFTGRPRTLASIALKRGRG